MIPLEKFKGYRPNLPETFIIQLAKPSLNVYGIE
jgi:hypothetical protein